MYPTVVIVLVETQGSMTDVCETSQSNTSKLKGPVASKALPATLGPTLGHLSFEVGSVNDSTTDNETESQRRGALESQGWQEHDLEMVSFSK